MTRTDHAVTKTDGEHVTTTYVEHMAVSTSSGIESLSNMSIPLLLAVLAGVIVTAIIAAMIIYKGQRRRRRALLHKVLGSQLHRGTGTAAGEGGGDDDDQMDDDEYAERVFGELMRLPDLTYERPRTVSDRSRSSLSDRFKRAFTSMASGSRSSDTSSQTVSPASDRRLPQTLSQESLNSNDSIAIHYTDGAATVLHGLL